jgi:hypothetical protein
MSSIETNLKIAIQSALDGNSDVNIYPIYYDHTPQNDESGNLIKYPLITYRLISSKRFWSMRGDVSGSVHNYAPAIIEFQVFGNENQYEDLTEISDAIEELFDHKELTMSDGVNFGIYKLDTNEPIPFFRDGEKVWVISSTYRFFIGK